MDKRSRLEINHITDSKKKFFPGFLEEERQRKELKVIEEEP
jgi:hypothetical protein